MNTTKFRQTMIAHCDTQEQLGDYLGLSQSAISSRIHGKVDFRQSEINMIITRYQLSPEQTKEIFFENDVS